MEQHPIPRQITTFEFKLIGFLTLKQFIYILIFFSLGFVGYLLTPIPILNYLLGFLIGGVGLAFAFVPINDRPMDIWIKNLIKRLNSPTQYNFKKENKPPVVLLDIVRNYSSQIVVNYIDSQQKLNNYLASKNQNQQVNNKKQKIINILNQPQTINNQVLNSKRRPPTTNHQPLTTNHNPPATKIPFISGNVKNYKNIGLAGILIYVKKEEDSLPIRILKTNSHGVFLSFNPLPPGDYILEIKDPKQLYFFDTMKLRIENENNKLIEIRSKELI